MKADRKPDLVTLKKPESESDNNKILSLSAHRSRAERKAIGKALRDKCPRISHAKWKPPHDRPDPVRLVLKADEGRLPDLLALRHDEWCCLPSRFTVAPRLPWR